MLTSPPRIGLLPEHLIDQIKAGEVIERPGNLIKEIMENSIDAGSTRLELTLKNNGLDLINLKDNGHGILAQDLPLAFSRHATSKISRFEDLYHLSSFGFRGEALASICAISKVQCITFNEKEAEGSELRIEGGLTVYSGSRQKNSGQHGTDLNIQDLFFNTPARLKFIQSQVSERNFLKKVIFSFIMAHPKIEFIIKFDDEEKEIYPSRETLKERLQDIIPKGKDQIQHTQRFYENNELDLYIVPGQFKAPLKIQYTFINQRFVIDKQLMRVISNALLSVFGTDEYHFVAFVNLPQDHIDVNVHPNKTIIKLFESSKVISLISGAIKELGQSSKPQVNSQALTPVTLNETQFSMPSFDQGLNPSLLQERHDYNMSGVFSPHRLTSENEKIIWIDQYFLYSSQQTWLAFAAGKLLEAYVIKKLDLPSQQTIPLLVSEPFKFSKADELRIQKLNEQGIELEKLSSDTVVLRSIPDWMNGFPLKCVLSPLIYGHALQTASLLAQDWSPQTWINMIHEMGMETLISQKIATDLPRLLKENL